MRIYAMKRFCFLLVIVMISGFPGIAAAAPLAAEPVWTLDINRLNPGTVPNPADANAVRQRYLYGSAYRPGFLLRNAGQPISGWISVVHGATPAVEIQYAYINRFIEIQTGTAAGGTHTEGMRAAPDSFTPVPGATYRFVFNASIDSGTGGFRIRGNAGTNNNINASGAWHRITGITTTPREIELVWTQLADGGNVVLCNGSASNGMSPAPTASAPRTLTLSNIRIYELVGGGVPGDDIVHVTNPAMTGRFAIESPYANVDWDAHYQFRTALHTHSLRSDGSASLRNMILDHYNKGFDIFAGTDHSVLCTGDWTSHPPAAPPANWWGNGWNSSANLMTAADQTAINNGTWNGALPADSRFTARYGFIRPEIRSRMGMPPGQDGVGMISVPNSNEQSYGNHVLTYWANFTAPENHSVDQILTSTRNLGGLAVMAHPGRHTCSAASRCNINEMCSHAGGRGIAAASNMPREVTRHVNWLRQFPSLVGMEIYNRPDNETRKDRILWDNVLMQIMPEGNRSVWGFANDDSHSMNNASLNWNMMLMPSLTDGNFRTAMQSGAFYMVSRVDRQLGVNAYVSTNASADWHIPLMAAPAPVITNISVRGQTITVEGANYDEIMWITGNPRRIAGDTTQGGGVVISTGNTLDLSLLGRYVWGNYVRAVLICRTGVPGTAVNSHGVALTQPFGVFVCDVCPFTRPGFGDVDGNGFVNAADITLLRRFIATDDKYEFLKQHPNFILDNADLYGDGTITYSVVELIRQHLASLDW